MRSFIDVTPNYFVLGGHLYFTNDILEDFRMKNTSCLYGTVDCLGSAGTMGTMRGHPSMIRSPSVQSVVFDFLFLIELS